MLVSTSDGEMNWQHYMTLLGPHLPAGTYDEVVYFLPHAITYLWSHDEAALDLCTTIIWFASEYAEDLERDGLLAGVRAEMLELLRRWTRDFRIQHFDENACKAKGWRFKHRDLVKMSEVVCQSMQDLDRFHTHADLIDSFLRGVLIDFEQQPVKAAWLVELAHARHNVYTPPSTPSVDAVLNDRDLIQRAMSVAIRADALRCQSPTYWQDVAVLLDLKHLEH